MKRRNNSFSKLVLFFWIGLVALFDVTWCFSQSLESKKKYNTPKYRVFLIDNQKYQQENMSLLHARDDGDAYELLFKNLLNTPSVSIHRYSDVSLLDFVQATFQYKKLLQPDEVSVVIYIGHGNVSGMPLFTDHEFVKPNFFYKFINSFENDTILIMDSCYSGNEKLHLPNMQGVSSWLFSSSSKDKFRYRANVVRLYSSLGNQESREGAYVQSKKLKQIVGKTYDFLQSLGFKGTGNGIFTLAFMSFFASLQFEKRASYDIQDLFAFLSQKLNAIRMFGSEQRSRLLPTNNNFLNKENYCFFYKDKEKLLKEDGMRRRYFKALFLQQNGDIQEAIRLFRKLHEENKHYLDVSRKISECYVLLVKKYNITGQRATAILNQALFFDDKNYEGSLLLARFLAKDKDYASVRRIVKDLRNKSLESQAWDWFVETSFFLIKIAWELQEFEKAERIATNMLLESEAMKIKRNKMLVLMILGELQLVLKKYVKAHDNFLLARSIAHSLGLPDVVARIRYAEALGYFRKRRYGDVVKNLFNVQAEEVQALLKYSPKTLIAIYWLSARSRECLKSMEMISEAHQKYRKALELAETIKEPNLVAKLRLFELKLFAESGLEGWNVWNNVDEIAKGLTPNQMDVFYLCSSLLFLRTSQFRLAEKYARMFQNLSGTFSFDDMRSRRRQGYAVRVLCNIYTAWLKNLFENDKHEEAWLLCKRVESTYWNSANLSIQARFANNFAFVAQLNRKWREMVELLNQSLMLGFQGGDELVSKVALGKLFLFSDKMADSKSDLSSKEKFILKQYVQNWFLLRVQYSPRSVGFFLKKMLEESLRLGHMKNFVFLWKKSFAWLAKSEANISWRLDILERCKNIGNDKVFLDRFEEFQLLGFLASWDDAMMSSENGQRYLNLLSHAEFLMLKKGMDES